MTLWIAMVLAGGGSYLLRAVPLWRVAPGRGGSPHLALLADAGTAALTALVVTSALHAGDGGATRMIAALGGVGIGIVVARRRSMLTTVVAGTAVQQALLFVLG
jgi:branched-subunit amino acid transport protein